MSTKSVEPDEARLGNPNPSGHGRIMIVPPGKVLDFIDGTPRNDTPEEYVRQEILKSLVREYGYSKEDIEVEFPIKFGSRRVRVDVAVFPPGLDRSEVGGGDAGFDSV